MKKYRYIVYFKNSLVPDFHCIAWNKEQAKILAQAEMIKQGRDYRVSGVIETAA